MPDARVVDSAAPLVESALEREFMLAFPDTNRPGHLDVDIKRGDIIVRGHDDDTVVVRLRMPKAHPDASNDSDGLRAVRATPPDFILRICASAHTFSAARAPVRCAKTLTGRPTPSRARSCRLRSLSRDRLIACDSLSGKTFIISNCRTTAVPKNVTDAPIRGMTASYPFNCSPL